MTQGISAGQSYAFRYRGINAVGPGFWSNLVVVMAAHVPLAPPKPYYIRSTNI